AGGTSPGSFLANGSTTPGIVFGGGTHDLSGSLGGSANGLIGVTSGTVNFTGTFTGGPTVAISGGVANFASGVSTAGVRLSGGSLAGVGTLTATSTFDWTGGSISGSGRIVIPTGAAMTLSGSTYKDLLSRTIDVEGTLTWRDYPLRGSLGPILNVLPGGVFDIQTDHWIEYCCSGGSPLTINVHAASGSATAGRVTKNVAAGTTPLNARLNNDGLVAPVSGTIELTAGGTSSGAFVVTPPGSVAFTAGTHDLNGTFGGDPSGVIRFGGGVVNVTSTFTGGPTWRLNGGTTNVSGSASLANVELIAGGLYVNGTLTATSAFAWTGGFLAGTGALEVPAGGTMTLSGTTYKDTTLATLNNRGSLVLRDYPVRASLGAQFVNHAGSLFDIQTDQGIAFCCSGGARPSFTNAGTLRKSAGVGTSVLETTLVNDGLVDLITGRITVVPSFVQGAAPATTKVTIAGPVPNTGYGVLGVTGPATLDGIFEVALANGYTPATASSYTPVAFESATGDFATKNGLVFPGGSFGYSRNATNVVLTATGCTAPPTTVTAPATVCPDSTGNVASVPLTAGATYLWTVTNGAITSGQGTGSITFSVGTATPVTVTVEVSVPGCQNSGTANVDVSAPQPVITAAGPTTFCVGGSVLLDAGSGYASYLWSNGATTQTIEVSESGTFSVTVTNAAGCAATSGAVGVGVTAAPTATSITSSSNPATEGQSLTLGATITPTGCTPTGPSATATVDGVLGAGEWGSAKVIQFPVNIGGGSTLPAALYLTSDSSNVYAALRVEGTALPSGRLSLEFLAAGCTGSDVIVYDFASGLTDQFRDASCTITADTATGGTSEGAAARGETTTYAFYELSHPLASGDAGRDLAAAAGDAIAFAAEVAFCPSGCEAPSLQNGTLVLGTASPRGFLTFFNGSAILGTAPVVAGHASLTVTSLPPGTHSITAQYGGDPAFATSSSGAFTQTVNPTCSASISPSGPTTFCSGGSVTLSASAGASYQWFSGGSPVSGATAQTLSVSTSGSYAVQVTAASGCSATSSAVTVTVNTPAAPTVTPSGPT
ncbi:MAG: Ig-like domain repeat protein, partial [Thermoanaerobaculia bacterium]